MHALHILIGKINRFYINAKIKCLGIASGHYR